MNIIFQINGGIGKCVMATAVCEAIKKQYPKSKLIVLSAYADVFLNNPYVDKSLAFGTASYFYQDYIQDQEFKILAHDPYFQTEHIKQDEHLIKTWCEMFGIKYNGEKPNIFLTEQEIKVYQSKYLSDKPILLLHTNGGAQTDLKYSWARDIPNDIAIQVIETFKKDYNIAHIRREDQNSFEGTFPVSDNFRSICVLIAMSKKRLLIDSFAQHVAASMGLKSTVCWIANSPKVFGYEINDNIICNTFTATPDLRNAFLTKFNIGSDLLEFPFKSEKDIFNISSIVKSIKSQN